MSQLDDRIIQVVAETLWRERPESQRWLPVTAFESVAETVVRDLMATQFFEEELQQLYKGWGRYKRSEGLHRRYVTTWEPV